MEIKKPTPKFRFIVLDENRAGELETEERARALFQKQENKYEANNENPVWAASSAAKEIFGVGYDNEMDWPMTLVGVDPKGRMFKVEVDMEMRPEFTPQKAIELYPTNVDDKTLELPFPELPACSKNLA